MTIGERIKNLREKKGLTQTELANIIGTTKQNIYKYETGIITNIPSDRIELISNVFGVSPAYLMGWEESMPKNSIPYEPDKMIPIPVIGRVAAGLTCLADMDIKCYELVDRDTICTGYDYIYLKVKGDSMEPLILEDDLVLVRIQSIVDSGDYAVVIVNGDDGLVKKINIEKNCITLMSENPYYPPRKFEKEAMNDIRIFGKVVESKRKF